jgi:hypothetical protein
MHATRPRSGRIPSSLLVVVLVAFVGMSLPARSLAADPSMDPVASGTPSPSQPPTSMCESLADLSLYVGFLRDQSLDEDGLLPILVGAMASLGEVRTLRPLVRDAYSPLIQELMSSLEEVATVARAGRDGTLGMEVARLGEAITRAGLAMDALSVALREPCPSAVPGGPSAPPA